MQQQNSLLPAIAMLNHNAPVLDRLFSQSTFITGAPPSLPPSTKVQKKLALPSLYTQRETAAQTSMATLETTAPVAHPTPQPQKLSSAFKKRIVNKRRSMGPVPSATEALDELHKLQARRVSECSMRRTSKVQMRERERHQRSKSVAFRLSRQLVKRDEQRILESEQRLRQSYYGHKFAFGIHGLKGDQLDTEREIIVDKKKAKKKQEVVHPERQFEEQDSYDEADEQEMAQELKGKTMDITATEYAQGRKQLKQFLSCFRELPGLRRNNLVENKFDAYLSECAKLKVAPRMHAIVNRRGPRSSIQADARLIGDTYANALGAGLQHTKALHKLSLARNALSDKGIKKILGALTPELLELDLSLNPALGRETYEKIAYWLGSPSTRLNVLKLHGNGAGDKLPELLTSPLLGHGTLRLLDIGGNKITDVGAEQLSEALFFNTSLRVLFVHWNKIGARGAALLAESLRENKGIQVLDLSFNCFGRGAAQKKMADSFSAMFQDNNTLLHIDLSQNSLNLEVCEGIANGLNKNRAVLGLHMRGNEAITDAQGFLRPEHDPDAHDAATHVYTRIAPHLQSGVITDKRVLELKPTANCWICEGWSQVRFSWRSAHKLEETSTVYLHLEIDRFEGDFMEQSKTDPLQYSLLRMLPPGSQRYFFSVDDEPFVDPDAPQVPNDMTAHDIEAKHQGEEEELEEVMDKHMQQIDPLLGERPVATPPRQTARAIAAPPPEKMRKIQIPATNYIENVVQRSTLVGPDWPVEPRPKARMMIKKRRARTPWDFGKSVFAEYKPDTELLLDDCFKFDWSQSKLEKILRDQTQAQEVKNYLRTVYGSLRDAYKFFSAVGPSNGIFSIGTNVFNEIVSSVAIVDKANLKLSDVDLDFVATNAGVAKRPGKNLNPERQLVRHQFLEIWVRLALSKYVKTKIIRSPREGVKRLYEEHLLSFFQQYDTQRFRKERLWCQDCDRIFKLYMPLMKALYAKYSGKFALPGQNPFMSLEEFTQLVTDGNVIDERFGARQIGMLFNVSMMTQVNELDSERHLRMQFPEFIEAIGRVADRLTLHSQNNIEFEYSQDSDAEIDEEEQAGKPLYQKLQDALMIFGTNCLGQDFMEHFQGSFKTLGFKFHRGDLK